MLLTPLAQRTLTAHLLGVPSGHNFQPRAPRGSLIPGWISGALLHPMAKCSGDTGETVRSQMLQKPLSGGGRGCVGTALQLSFAICPILLSHCPVTKVDTSYINPSQHLLSQRFVRSGTGSGNERDLHFSSAGWQPGCPLLGQEQHPKPPYMQVQVLFSVLAQSQATT